MVTNKDRIEGIKKAEAMNLENIEYIHFDRTHFLLQMFLRVEKEEI